MKKKVAIALQGGGAHGAFAWGVMDRLLEEGCFDIVGVSGTSAGGMNAASVIQGLLEGGDQGGRDRLDLYWQSISDMSAKMKNTPINHEIDPNFLHNADKLYGINHDLMQSLMGMIMAYVSPYDMNPENKNSFLDFLKDFFDYSLFQKNLSRRIFLGATHVKTGKIKVFSNEDMCADVLMASACLPHLFQTVMIDGEPYWDGGFIANPAIYPLMNLDTQDIIIVQLTKTYCDEVPKTKAGIVDRLKEITYNGCLVREMRAIHFVTNLIDKGLVKEGALKRFNMHLIKSEETFKDLKLSSALNPKWEFITALKAAGRTAAEEWIKTRSHTVGTQQNAMDNDLFKDFIS